MQTAAAPEEASGCFGFMVVPPAAVLLVSVFLATLAWKQPVVARPINAASGPSEAVSQPADVNSINAPFQYTGTTVTPIPGAESSPGTINAQIVESAPQTTSLSPIFRPEVQYWAESITRWSADHNLDPNLAAVVMQIESCGDPRATSRSGAMGLFQVMPFHFYTSDSPYDPDTNAARGLAYLARSLAAGGGNARLALAGYNGGIGVISRGEWTWSAQTKRYVLYGSPIYEDARNGAESSSMLNEWYNKYGASLCRQAHQRLGLP
jgi:hypothetical protein